MHKRRPHHKKRQEVFVRAKDLLKKSEHHEGDASFRMPDQKSHTYQHIVLLEDENNVDDYKLTALREKPHTVRNKDHKDEEKFYFDIELNTAEKPIEAFEGQPKNTKVFAVLKPKAEWFRDVFPNIEYDLEKVVGGDAASTKLIKQRIQILAERERGHYDFKNGQEVDIDKLASKVLLLSDHCHHVAKARTKEIQSLMKPIAGGTLIDIKMTPFRENAGISIEIADKFLVEDLETVCRWLPSVSIKESKEAPKSEMRPAARFALALLTALNQEEIETASAKEDQPAEVVRLPGHQYLQIVAKAAARTLGLDADGFRKVLGIGLRTGDNWFEGNVDRPFFRARIAALILMILAKASMMTS